MEKSGREDFFGKGLLFCMDKHGSLISWNSRCEEETEFRSSEVVGMQFEKLCSFPERPLIQKIIANPKKECNAIQLPFFTKSGVMRMLHLQPRAQEDKGDGVANIVFAEPQFSSSTPTQSSLPAWESDGCPSVSVDGGDSGDELSDADEERNIKFARLEADACSIPYPQGLTLSLVRLKDGETD